MTVEYRVEVADAHAHQFRVTLTLSDPAPEQRLSLPVWIPGSYMVREFGRHLSALAARQGRRPCALRQLDKTTWVVACEGRTALTVSWLVYAFDTSVRCAFLDARRGFFNGTGLLLRAEGREHEPQGLTIAGLPRGWQVATAMTPVKVNAAGVGRYEAADYDELVDHPVELGTFWRGRFEAGGVPHEFVVAGALPGFDGERLLADARRICATQIGFWHGGSAKERAPFSRYVFLLNAVEEGYGGLEHRASTALIAARRDLPRRGMEAGGGLSDGYVTLLGLISHEYFHTWNVKRLKPAEFTTLDYTRENYTELLWFFEGFTSYYDDLLLLRAGLIDAPRYLRLVAKAASTVLATPGREVQSVAQASFDAWVKYYRSDENTPNATVSYYAKGSLVALALDLALRSRPRSRASLDDVMRALWARSGAAGGGGMGGGGITELDILAVVAELGGRALADELRGWVHGTADLPLERLLAGLGVRQADERVGFAVGLGLRLAEGALTGVQVKSVLAGTAAQRAGLSAGDELLAVDGWRIRRLDDALTWIDRRQPFELLVVRDQRVLTLRLDPAAGRGPAAIQLTPVAKPPAAALARRRAWLGH